MACGVIFDLDGTLIDSALTILEIINAMRVERSGAATGMCGVRPHLSKGGLALVRSCLGEHAREGDADLQLFRQRYAEVRQGPEILFGEAERVLARLQALGYRLAICTNKPTLLARNALDHTGLARYFDVVVAGEPDRPSKPDPASLLECCEGLGLQPADCVYVGDSEVDAEAAARARMRFVFAAYGYPVGDASAITRHATVDCLSELPAVMERGAVQAVLGDVG